MSGECPKISETARDLIDGILRFPANADAMVALHRYIEKLERRKPQPKKGA